MSSNNTPHSNAGSVDEDDPWELVGDEIAPFAASLSQDDDNATAAVPAGDAKHGPSESEAGAPQVTSDDDDEQGDVGTSGAPSANAGHPLIVDGGVSVNNGTLDNPASLPNSPENPGKADAGERTKEDSGELEEPHVPPSPVAEAPDVPGAPLASAPTAGVAHPRFRPLKETCSRSTTRSQTSLEPVQTVTETSDSRDAAASPPVASAPAAGSSEGDAEGGKSDGAALVNSLLGMGFDLERIEKALGDLRDAGAEVNEDSVIGAIVGELTEDWHAWEFLQTAVGDFEGRHELRRRARDCIRSLAFAREESLRGGSRASLREAYDNARTAAVQVRYAASSAKDGLCRANAEYGIAEKVATAAAVGGALLLALGSPRAGVGAMAVAGTTMAAGEAMRQASARSTSTDTRDHGLREGLHLD